MVTLQPRRCPEETEVLLDMAAEQLRQRMRQGPTWNKSRGERETSNSRQERSAPKALLANSTRCVQESNVRLLQTWKRREHPYFFNEAGVMLVLKPETTPLLENPTRAPHDLGAKTLNKRLAGWTQQQGHMPGPRGSSPEHRDDETKAIHPGSMPH